MKWISKYNTHTVTHREMFYAMKGNLPGNPGYCFQLDENDNPIYMSPEAEKCFHEAFAKGEYEDGVIRTWDEKVKDFAVIECDCGRNVTLDGRFYGTTECDCGRCWSMTGQETLNYQQQTQLHDW